MDLGTVLSVAQTLYAALQCQELKDLCSYLGYKEELEKLQDTVRVVKAVLHDAESNQVHADLSSQAQLYIDDLKDAVFDADDLLDEFLTHARQTKLIKGGKLSQMMHLLFWRFNSLATARKMSQGVQEIRAKLDAIASLHGKFGFRLDSQPTRKRREETCSYEDTQDIIGREPDLQKIMDILLDSNVKKDVSCLTIMGIGGLGKTTLAQLIFNHPRIGNEFHPKLWTCVSDQDPKHLDVEAILHKILHSATSDNHKHLKMEHLQRKVREQLEGKKYLLVLDDVWNENDLEWPKLVKFLKGGLKGSWIVVTTRSEETARVVRSDYTHKLGGLSEEHSWRLFKRKAFGEEREQANHPELVQIGQEIVQRCVKVPLAITVVGSLLYGQGIKKWQSFKEVGLGRIKQGKEGIEPILKLSYDHLESPLKTCFSFCALFPKDFKIEKEMLISLWMAQGFIVPLEEGQSIDDVAEEYFFILLRRGFFQDVKKNDDDGIISCKIHDLMHDIAQEVAGLEVRIVNSISSSLDKKIRHLSHLPSGEPTNRLLPSTKIRTYLQVGCKYGRNKVEQEALGTLVANWKCLRVLELRSLGMNELPNTLGKLLHLRYLDLSGNNELEVLPDSITKLHNLQTLILNGCWNLKELPKELSKLTELRVLDTKGCSKLCCMRRGMGSLSSLRKLPYIVVAEKSSRKEWGPIDDQIEEIKALRNLQGNLHIQICVPENAKLVIENARKGGRLSQHLNKITISWHEKIGDEDDENLTNEVYDEALLEELQPHPENELYDEALLEELQPHPDLKTLRLEGYYGGRMPSWAMSLPNLVSIQLSECRRLQCLGILGKLPKLKVLILEELENLEYIENTTLSSNSSGVEALESEQLFFPSLESLYLDELPKLKGWWRDDGIIDCETKCRSLLLPCLSQLRIFGCPNLTSVITCPPLKESLLGESRRDRVTIIESGDCELKVATSNVRPLKSALPIEAFGCLQQMIIRDDKEMESLSEVEVFCTSSSSLRALTIRECPRLKSLGGGLEHLTALEELTLHDLPQLNLTNGGEGDEDDGMPWLRLERLRSLTLEGLPRMAKLPKGMRYLTALEKLTLHRMPKLNLTNGGEGEEDDGMPWRGLQQSLRSLTLSFLTVKLPVWMRYLTALQDLLISYCSEVESVPEWMRELTSLKSLSICPSSAALQERCREGTGEDWPNIQHIPHRHTSNNPW